VAAGTRIMAVDPYPVPGVDENAVFGIGPVVARGGTAPRLDELASRIEFDHRRCRVRPLSLRRGPRPVQDPYVTTPIDRDPRWDAKDPVVRQLRGPRGVDVVLGDARVCPLGVDEGLPSI